MTALPDRMPVVYLPHGGGPWPFVDLGPNVTDTEPLAVYLRSVASVPPVQPAAVLVISAHWEQPVPTVMTAARPPLLYDYYGFPPAAYELSWPAPGAPTLAARVRAALANAGIDTAEDADRGFDHGTFIPLMLTYPDASIPTTQLSLEAGLDPDVHLAIGRALAPLRDEGVFIIGSGMSFHDLRAFFDPGARPAARAFDGWLRETATMAPAARAQRLRDWERAPSARACHPREEHLLPLMVIAGAAGEDPGVLGFGGTFAGQPICALHFGA